MPETDDDDDLLEALGVDVPVAGGDFLSVRNERLIAGFDDISRFVDDHAREPRALSDADIFERLLATRLNALRANADAVSLLVPRDRHGLLACATDHSSTPAELDDETLLSQLGVNVTELDSDIELLRHVKPFSERRSAEEIGARKPCRDFDEFRVLFEAVEKELRTGVRSTIFLKTRALGSIREDTFFVVGGQLAYITKVTASFTTQYDRPDSRLRVVFDNGTESDVLQRSFQRALHRDPLARIVSSPVDGPLFDSAAVHLLQQADSLSEADAVSGTIYVLRSRSAHPFVAEHREVIHKIGVTTGPIGSRIANAAREATYLLADVELVATYELVGIQPNKLENLFHRIFACAQIDITIADRFGIPVRPREWFLVPINVIDEAVDRLRDGSIERMVYDPAVAMLVERQK